jgi:hypothetical protein
MVTDKQIAALKYLVGEARIDGDLAKQIAFFLLDQSDHLEKQVCICLVDGEEGFDKAEIKLAAYAIDAMHSSSGPLHFSEIMSAVGSEMHFSTHYGAYMEGKFNSDGIFAGLRRSIVMSDSCTRQGMPYRYTFWLAKSSFSDEATLVQVSKDELSKINLEKPGLYPSTEESMERLKLAS